MCHIATIIISPADICTTSDKLVFIFLSKVGMKLPLKGKPNLGIDVQPKWSLKKEALILPVAILDNLENIDPTYKTKIRR